MASEDNELPAAPGFFDSITKVYDTLTGKSDAKAVEAVGGAVPAAGLRKITLPKLETVAAIGYMQNQPVELNLASIGGVLLEHNTALDFLLMQRAALAAGFELIINSGFRSAEDQKQIYARRYNPDGTKTPEGLKKGPAAKPNTSNHQGGIAIDIRVGMTVDDLREGRTTPVFEWLKENIAKFGFDRTDAPSEPWHYTHRERKVVGAASYELVEYVPLTETDKAAIAAIGAYTKEHKIAAKKVHDTGKSFERGLGMGATSRSAMLQASAAEQIARSARLKEQKAALESVLLKTTSVTPPVDPETTSAYTYNFETGRWGDNGVV